MNKVAFIDYQPGDGRKRGRLPAWLTVLLVLALFVVVNVGVGRLLMKPVPTPVNPTSGSPAVP
jgi:hypothetical protein